MLLKVAQLHLVSQNRENAIEHSGVYIHIYIEVVVATENRNEPLARPSRDVLIYSRDAHISKYKVMRNAESFFVLGRDFSNAYFTIS